MRPAVILFHRDMGLPLDEAERMANAIEIWNAETPQARAAVMREQAESYGRHAAMRGERQATVPRGTSFQARCQSWLDIITEDDPTELRERSARFLEEALELVQSLGMKRTDALDLVGYVFDRPAGEPAQEFGGMLTTAAVLAQYVGQDLNECGERELARVFQPEMITKVKAKRATRHGRGPLPGSDGCRCGRNGFGCCEDT